MSHEIRQLFESRHVQEYLDIDKDRLFHWVKTKRLINPAIEGRGRGKKSKFSFENLLDLALTKELTNYGVELNMIKDILSGISNYSLDRKSRIKKTIWQTFKDRRSHYEKKGCVLTIEWGRLEEEWVFDLLEGEEILEQLHEDILLLSWEAVPAIKSILLINIFGIIDSLEKKVGMKFE